MTFRFTRRADADRASPFGFRLRHTRIGIKSDAVWQLRPVGDTALGNLQVKVYKGGANRSCCPTAISRPTIGPPPGNGPSNGE